MEGAGPASNGIGAYWCLYMMMYSIGVCCVMPLHNLWIICWYSLLTCIRIREKRTINTKQPVMCLVSWTIVSCMLCSVTIACYCLLLPAIACYCLLLPAIACYCLLLPAIACYCLLLPAIACYCLLLPAIACYCLVVISCTKFH